MKTTSEKQSVETIKVCYDMAPDILDIIVREKISHEITDAESHNCYFRLKLSYDAEDTRIRQVISRIQHLLDEYEYYRHSDYNELNWLM